jgi:hypothetical protein
VNAVFEFTSNPVYILVFAILLSIIILYIMKVSNAFSFYINESKRESKEIQSAMNETIKKMRDQIKLLKLGVQNVKIK